MNRKFGGISDAAHVRGRFWGDFFMLYKVGILIDFVQYSRLFLRFRNVRGNKEEETTLWAMELPSTPVG